MLFVDGDVVRYDSAHGFVGPGVAFPLQSVDAFGDAGVFLRGGGLVHAEVGQYGSFQVGDGVGPDLFMEPLAGHDVLDHGHRQEWQAAPVLEGVASVTEEVAV